MTETAEAPPAPPAAEQPQTGAPCEHCGAAMAADQEWCIECGAARTVIRRGNWAAPVAIVGGVCAAGLVALAIALIGLSGDANRVADTKIASTTATVTVQAPASATTPAPATTVPATPASPAITIPAPVNSATGGGSAGATATPTHPAAHHARTPTVPRTTTTTTTRTTPATSSTSTTTSTTTTRTAHLASWPPGLGGWTVVLYSNRDRTAAFDTAQQLAQSLSGIGVLNSSDHPDLQPGYYVVFDGRYPDRASAGAAAAKLKAQGQPTAHARMVEPPGGN